MGFDDSPTSVGRTHALHRIAECIDDLIADRPIPPNAAERDREYLTAFVSTARSVAARLRNSPGYEP